MSKRHRMLGSGCILLAGWLLSVAAAADWPQFGGPTRDAISNDTGLLKQWPDGGPKRLWVSDVDLGAGYSSVAVVGDRIYTTGVLGDKQGYVFALDLAGKPVWKTAYGPEWTQNFPSARTTPTVEGDRLYVMSGLGRAVCLGTADGKEAWAVDTAAVFGGKNIRWGIAESILLHGDLAICTPGGPDASLVALDKATGRTVWTSKGLSDRSAYCSPITVKDAQRDLIVTVTEHHIVGVNAADGRVLWRHPYENKWQAHANSPLYHDGGIYVTSGYDAGGVMLQLSPDGSSVKVRWQDKTLDTHHGGVLRIGEYIYGASWIGNGNGNWVCLDWATGKVKYDTKWENKGSLVAAEGMLYCYEERRGNVALVKATPNRFKPESTFRVDYGKAQHWAHPAIANGRLYLRHGNALAAYDINAR